MASPIDSEPDTGGYRTVFKSSSMLGGSQGINYLLGFVRTKSLAYLLGPTGIGLLGLYSSISGTVGALATMGIGESSVREIAVAYGEGNQEKLQRVAQIVRRVCLMCGFLGLILSVAFAMPLSVLSFGNNEHWVPIAILGFTLLLGSITGGEVALLQGSRQFAHIAKINILSSAVSILPVICIYAIWKEAGIVPAVLLSYALILLVTLLFSRSISAGGVRITWKETFSGARPLLYLGFAFMLSGLLVSGKDILIRSMITKSYGLESMGIYQSAWTISALFVSFVLRAMGMDFYPRLTAMLNEHNSMVKAVNQQIEVGILLALPGVIATITCAPMVLLILYSSKFHSGSGLLAVLSCGVFFKVISYPLNMIQLAKGDARGFIVFGAAASILELVLSVSLLLTCGLIGVALGYAITCFAHIFAMAWVGREMIDYRISKACGALLFGAFGYICVGLSVAYFLSGVVALCAGGFLVLISTLYCIRGLARRLGSDHRIMRMVLMLPCGRFIMP